MKLKNFFSMAAIGLTAVATLTSCEDVLGHWERPTGPAVTPATPEELITKYEFKVTDLADADVTGITAVKLTDAAGTVSVTAKLGDNGNYNVEKSDLASATMPIWVEVTAAKTYIQKLTAEDLAALETSKKLTVATIGDVITSEGAFAAKGAAEEQAVIAYVGKVDKYFTKFLAIALEDAASNQSWANALTKAGEYAAAHAITIGGTTYNTSTTGSTYYDQVADDQTVPSATATDAQQGWRLPSVTDLRYILDGLGRINGGLTLTARKGGNTYSSNATPEDPLGVVDMIEYRNGSNGSTLLSAINTACGNTELKSSDYWISSECSGISTYAWYYKFDVGKFANNSKTSSFHVRAVFAY